MPLYRPLRSVAVEYIDWARSDHPRIPTGYSILDSRTSGGVAPGELLLFTCRSGVGKTTFANNVVINNLGRPTVFFSLEMHARYILNRLAAIYSGVPTATIEYELKTTGRNDAIQRLVDDFPLLAIVDKPALTFKEMHLALAEAEQDFGQKVELVVIDFLELIGGIPSISGGAEPIDKVARKAKDFSREEDVVTLLLHQVGRGAGGAGDVPLDMTSGRYGGETFADYVLGAYSPAAVADLPQALYLEKRWEFYLQFLKTRGGSEKHPGGLLHCFNPYTMRITEEWQQEPLPLFPAMPIPPDPDFEVRLEEEELV